jgi:hypothetical protein
VIGAVEVVAPRLGRCVIAGSLGLESALNPVLPTEGPLLNLLGHSQVVPIGLVAVGFVVVAAGSELALGLPWLPSGVPLMWVGGPWTSFWVEVVSPLARNFDLEPAASDRPVTLSPSASHMVATELGYGFAL